MANTPRKVLWIITAITCVAALCAMAVLLWPATSHRLRSLAAGIAAPANADIGDPVLVELASNPPVSLYVPAETVADVVDILDKPRGVRFVHNGRPLCDFGLAQHVFVHKGQCGRVSAIMISSPNHEPREADTLVASLEQCLSATFPMRDHGLRSQRSGREVQFVIRNTAAIVELRCDIKTSMTLGSV